MRQEMPANHGLLPEVERTLVHKNVDGTPSLTDIQYDALAAGVGRGESLLIISPTSTGKTQIAMWGMASRLLQGGRVVYLVTHRALAKQKFQELLGSYLLAILGADKSRICLATGDDVVDGDGNPPKDPLQIDLLVATYEKYLALISGSGIPGSLRDVCVVCDEIQLIGDAHRGQSVEVLLTLLRKATWGQLVALSAVLSMNDAAELADWLGVALVPHSRREKHLRYELRAATGTFYTSTADPGRVIESPPLPIPLDCIAIVRNFLANPAAKPLIVFCMKKDDTTRLARELIDSGACAAREQLSFEFMDMPDTNATGLLRDSLVRRVAVHNADLTDDERAEVERKLLAGSLDVVFATSSLAAGVNFPFATAVFHSWDRWNSNIRAREPIDASEFHNMAGRAGRMGFEHEEGKVVFTAPNAGSTLRARNYLDLTRVEELKPRIEKSHFLSLVLQLVSSGICSTRAELVELISETFSGLREADRNAVAFASWPDSISVAIQYLIDHRLLVMGVAERLTATPVGKACAHAGLQPATTIYLLSNVVSMAESLVACLPGEHSDGRMDGLLFALARICLASPEFVETIGARRTRYLPWPLHQNYIDGLARKLDRFDDPSLSPEPEVLNSAAVATDWAEGLSYSALEAMAPSLSAGMIRELTRNLAWILQGLSALLIAGTDPRVPQQLRPSVLQVDSVRLGMVRKLPRAMARMVKRLNEGLPDELLWMLELNAPNEPFRISRDDALRLRANGMATPLAMMSGDGPNSLARETAFANARPSPQAKANWARDRARAWKADKRRVAATRQIRRAARCPNSALVAEYYAALGNRFEQVFESVLTALGINWERLDDRSRVGAPDYLVRLVPDSPLIVELKTRENERLVDYNNSVEVLAASEIHGYRDAFCVTLCHPGVDPSVPSVIARCGRLCVVESHDLGDAFLRICEGDLDRDQFNRWLTTPGQATSEDLPFREY